MEPAAVLGNDLATARVICVLVHGRTQTPEDMQDQVIRQLKTAGVVFVLPRQPSKSWYDAKAVDVLTDGTRAQLATSQDDLAKLIATVRAKSNPPLLLGGFSLGACQSGGLSVWGPACRWNARSGVARLMLWWR